MRRETLMAEFKKKYNGEIIRESGRWFWKDGIQKHLISNNWLLKMLFKKTKEKSNPTEVSKVEIQQLQDEVVVENVGIETPVEEQEPKNDSPTPSEEEVKRLKNEKRREKRLQRKLEKQKKDEQSN
jgi:hypothetical protein